MNLSLLDSDKPNEVYKRNGKNNATDFCYHILFGGTVNDTSRMLLCS